MWGSYTPEAGLCEQCVNVRIVENRRGSRFFLCQLAEVDPRFPKYPRLPVLRCRGFSPVADVPAEEEPRAAADPARDKTTDFPNER